MQITCTAVQVETDTVTSFRFTADQTVDFIPGQFLTLVVPVEDRKSARAYSLSSIPTDNELQLTIKRVDGGRVSNHLLDNLKAGDSLEALAPAGEFHRDAAGGQPWLLLGAGCGVTPLYSMLRDRLSKQANADITVVFSARYDNERLFAGPLAELALKHPNLKLHWLISSESGRLTAERLAELAPDIADRAVMTCGPQAYMDAAVANAKTMGATNVHSEAFMAVNASLSSHEGEMATAEMSLSVDGIELPILPNQTVLESLEKGGIQVMAACRAGVCGTCKCKGEKGKFKSTSTMGLTPEEIEQGYFLACASTATTSMEVEVDD
ncbi:flavin reductase family protein [Ferrimonas lipolytica]|uniref:Iron-sulfur cluster-binding domain-containing protein n=1 Tax=Ferrimonas lipolytica TaxID=2724191 RepID=A0A6H1UFY4_9GAMM|nr:iron-sulfur cluster-binding domain-containing protein [Ferrimonas lipolytica]QIZ77126.1 iron-sulfur cluster-binding domain-containing protein [Ferrimonas lipolytica]